MAVTSEQLIGFLAPQKVEGQVPSEILEVVRLDAPPGSRNQLFWCSDKNSVALDSLAGGTVICSPRALERPCNPRLTYLVVENPRLGFLRVVRQFFAERHPPRIESTAVIDASVKLGKNISIGHYAVLEPGCVVGDGSSVGPHTVLHRNTVVGSNVVIGANNTIGGVGFGYEKGEDGQYELIPHLGNVIIEDGAEIGNNTCIDRAPLGSTRIGRNAKIDNLVHVAHGCIIGDNALLIAHAMIGGSTEIGAGSWIAPCAAIKNGITIGANSVIGLGAVVVKPVEPNTTVVGNPARLLQR